MQSEKTSTRVSDSLGKQGMACKDGFLINWAHYQLLGSQDGWIGGGWLYAPSLDDSGNRNEEARVGLRE